MLVSLPIDPPTTPSRARPISGSEDPPPRAGARELVLACGADMS
jgi:hypothetical protein